MRDASERSSLALAAAPRASEATSELLRFAREADGPDGPFEIEVVEKLADALELALAVGSGDQDDDARQIYRALMRFLEGWA